MANMSVKLTTAQNAVKKINAFSDSVQLSRLATVGTRNLENMRLRTTRAELEAVFGSKRCEQFMIMLIYIEPIVTTLLVTKINLGG